MEGGDAPERVAVLAPTQEPAAAVGEGMPAPREQRSEALPPSAGVAPARIAGSAAGAAAKDAVNGAAKAAAKPWNVTRTFAVQVVDTLGNVVPDARIDVGPPGHAPSPQPPAPAVRSRVFAARESASVTADAEGRCDLVTTGPVALCASKEGVGTSGEWRPSSSMDAPAAPVPVRFELHRMAHVTGTVLDVPGQRLARATVTVESDGLETRGIRPRNPPPVTTDDRGRFAVDVDAPGIVLVSATNAAGESSAKRSLTLTEGGLFDVELRVVEACVLTGRVLDEAGQPVASARVELVRPVGAWTTSGADGSFRLETRQRGTCDVGVTADGLVQQDTVQVALADGQQPEPLTLRMLKSKSLAGHVVRDDGTAVDRAVITADAKVPKDDRHSARSSVTTMSDARGWFEIPDVDPRFVHDVRATALKPVETHIVAAGVAAGTRDLVLTLPRPDAAGRTIALVVVDERTGNPVTDYDLTWGLFAGGPFDGETTHVHDESGRHTVTARSDDRRVLLVEATGYPPTTVDPLKSAGPRKSAEPLTSGDSSKAVDAGTPADGATEFTIRLAHAGSLVVTVVDSAGVPVPEAQVFTVRMPVDGRANASAERGAATTDVSGKVSFRTALPGRTMLRAQRGKMVCERVFVDVLPDQPNLVTLTLRGKR